MPPIFSLIKKYASALRACRLVTVRGDSMEPALGSGDYVWCSAFAYLGTLPARYDVVLARVPKLPRPVVKRVVGLPGERVEVRANRLWVDGAEIYEYRAHNINEARAWELGADEYVLLGDNWARSNDSRYFGTVKAGQIIGKLNSLNRKKLRRLV